MARQGAYKSEKRKKEVMRLKKQEEKRQKRMMRNTASPLDPENTTEEGMAGREPHSDEIPSD